MNKDGELSNSFGPWIEMCDGKGRGPGIPTVRLNRAVTLMGAGEVDSLSWQNRWTKYSEWNNH